MARSSAVSYWPGDFGAARLGKATAVEFGVG